jgi:HlyD family secretion protein
VARPRLARGGLVLLVVLALGLAYAYGGRMLDGPRPTAVTVTGTVEATEVDVSATLSGRIVALAADEGERVEAGQVLARLDDDELRAEVGRQDAALRAARAALRDLEAGARREEIEEAAAAVRRAQAQLRDLEAGARTQEIEEARAALASAEVTRGWTARDLRRAEELYAKELIAAQDVDRARQAYDVAATQERAARARLAMLLEGPRPHEVEGARAQLEAARDRLALLRAGPRPDQVDAARAQVAQAESALALARSRLREATVTAPIPGIVLRKNLEAGEIATPGVTILTLMDPTRLWVRAYVPEDEVGRVKLGDPARVTVDSHPDRVFAGQVSEIAARAEFTPKNVQTKKERVTLVFRIKITLDNPEGILKPGMPADARIG